MTHIQQLHKTGAGKKHCSNQLIHGVGQLLPCVQIEGAQGPRQSEQPGLQFSPSQIDNSAEGYSG